MDIDMQLSKDAGYSPPMWTPTKPPGNFIHELLSARGKDGMTSVELLQHGYGIFWRSGMEVTMAKLATQRAAYEAADAALDLLGDEPALARAARDARLGPIGGGTDEIMNEILGKTLGL